MEPQETGPTEPPSTDVVLDARLTLRQLDLFVAAAEHGSFAAAAQHAYVTPNAVASAVSDLESVLGATLAVRRRARGLTLTPSGVRLLDGARDLLRRASELRLSIGEHGGVPVGPVAVGCYSTLAPTVVPELWARLAERHPGVELSVTEGTTDELVARLAVGELDVVIAYEVALPTELEVRPLYKARPRVVLSAEHRLADRDAVDVRDLADEPLILLDLPPSGANTLELLRRRGVRPQVAHRTTNIELVRSLVGRGLGYGVQFQRTAVQTSAEGRRLVTLPITPEPRAEPVVVAWPHRLALTSRAQAVVELAREVLAAPH
ncbi:LysR family transcriptional regulator [Tersicoccus sp. Bi-70]|uniref:LysR family transcriptional regulator n=1 Tax=Tersicoccus sp. Bi-70 TaxID=1897634 RepID=UPI000975AA47|nr:LysR family transcriptional regulator [Tersicoccus sp. Bi-70]OMH37185.1 hypothetical protein BGP79_13885 [Tersicoccus sp. Bi-70]